MAVRGGLGTSPEGLLSDDRILSSSDRELLKEILHHTQVSDTKNKAVTDAIARAIGEIISERASRLLGERVVDQLLREVLAETLPLRAGSPPNTPPPGPDLPPSPHPPSPGPPGQGISQTQLVRTTAVAADFVVLDEFLTPFELKELTEYVLQHESDFRTSEVISPGVKGGNIDFEQRRSRVLMDSGKHAERITARLRASLPQVLDRLGVEPFEISRFETQITASNHGDYFRWHTDNGAGEIASRTVTFVYFFHREPKAFHGGELRIYESPPHDANGFPTADFQTIVPEQNQMVVFRSSQAHEITPIECPSSAFVDSRFTVNGWLHR